MNNERILGIVGSPRRNGNTELIVNQILQGAEDGGLSAEKLILSKQSITPCIGCDFCESNEKCVQDDDMPQILEKMDQSSIWILGTPVYWWGPTAWMKAFIDRWYGGRHIIKFEGRKAILVIPFEDTNLRTGSFTEGMLKETLAYLKIDLLSSLLVPGVLHRGDVRSKDGILDQAYKLGTVAARNSKTRPRRI